MEWADKMWGDMRVEPSPNPVGTALSEFLPDVPHLVRRNASANGYYKLWPNMAFDIYPTRFELHAVLPRLPTQTLIREIAYVLPDAYTPSERRRR